MKNFLPVIVIFFLLAGACSVLAYEMGSSSYRIQSSSLNVGGASQSSTNYRMEETIGEIASDESASASYKLKAGYQQMQEVYISISASANVSMTPELQAITGGTSNGTATINVKTDSLAGYNLKLNVSTTPALKSGSAEFPDYTEASPPTPDYNWSIGAANSEFGFTPWGQDTVQKYRYIGTNCNQSGGTADENQCWDGFEGSTEIQIAQSSLSNHPSGTDTYVKYQGEIKSNGFQTPGNYAATVTATAAAN
jgi:hypothetical protein